MNTLGAAFTPASGGTVSVTPLDTYTGPPSTYGRLDPHATVAGTVPPSTQAPLIRFPLALLPTMIAPVESAFRTIASPMLPVIILPLIVGAAVPPMTIPARSEERRVGKEGRSRWSP